jgi:hypothetical protein
VVKSGKFPGFSVEKGSDESCSHGDALLISQHSTEFSNERSHETKQASNVKERIVEMLPTCFDIVISSQIG